MIPATHSTDDPPIKIEDIQLREYVFALRRRIEVQNLLAESLHEEIQRLKLEKEGLADQVERVLIDLHWMRTGRNMRP